jgi:hypothetical protein
MDPTTAIDTLSSFVGVGKDSGEVYDSAYLETAVETLREFVAQRLAVLPSVDAERLVRIVADAPWDVTRSDYNGLVAWPGDILAVALGWECTSCREDVGWPDNCHITKDGAGTVRLHVECGHCGATRHYDRSGNPLDEDS